RHVGSGCSVLAFASVRISFFFSSRRRHTRFSRDWSSDVCSSDLFPTVRMAQLAALIHRNGNLFSTLTHFHSTHDLYKALRSIQSPYWHTHYHFGKPAESLVPLMGTDAINLLIINAAVPLLAAFAHKTDQSVFLDKAVSVLEELPVENNKIIRKWKALGLRLNSAANSQGATQWYHRFCVPKLCLQCTVGNAIIRKSAIGSFKLE